MVLFDIQDVGARFYTYLSSLFLVMEAAAENGKVVVVLDRPNPHGHQMAGPMLDPKWKSFIGMLPVPVLHGMTSYMSGVDGTCAERSRIVPNLFPNCPLAIAWSKVAPGCRSWGED